MKSKKIIALGVSLVTIATNMFYFYPTGSSSSVSKPKKEIKEVKVGKKQRKGEQKIEKISPEKKQVRNSTSREDKKSEITVLNDKKSNNNTEKETKRKENINTGGYSNQQEQTKVQTPPPTPRVQTEWEKLGISEYAYYNSPGPNEGQIAFRGAESECEKAASDITNTYGFVTHYGDVKSYSERYIGCWITIHFSNGNTIFYNEFKVREERGEFKDTTK